MECICSRSVLEMFLEYSDAFKNFESKNENYFFKKEYCYELMVLDDKCDDYFSDERAR